MIVCKICKFFGSTEITIDISQYLGFLLFSMECTYCPFSKNVFIKTLFKNKRICTFLKLSSISFFSFMCIIDLWKLSFCHCFICVMVSFNNWSLTRRCISHLRSASMRTAFQAASVVPYSGPKKKYHF